MTQTISLFQVIRTYLNLVFNIFLSLHEAILSNSFFFKKIRKIIFYDSHIKKFNFTVKLKKLHTLYK